MGNPTPRGQHEQKPEQDEGFRGTYSPSSPLDPKRRVGNSERAPTLRTNLDLENPLTGQWRSHAGLYHLLINQAGRHIEILLAVVAAGLVPESQRTKKSSMVILDKVRTRTRVFRFGGDLVNDETGEYDLYWESDEWPRDKNDDPAGRLDVEGGTRGLGRTLLLDLDLRSTVDPAVRTLLEPLVQSSAVRIGMGPSMFENYLNHPWVQEAVRTAHWFPTTPQQDHHLSTLLLREKVTLDPDSYLYGPGVSFGYQELLLDFFALREEHSLLSPLSRREWQRLRNMVTGLDKIVLGAAQKSWDAKVEDGGIDNLQIEGFRLASLGKLESTKLRMGGHMASLLRLTKDMLEAQAGGETGNFSRYLGLEDSKDSKVYHGTLEVFDVAGAVDDGRELRKILKKASKKVGKRAQKALRHLPLGGIAGTLVVETKADPAFTATYALIAGGLKPSYSLGTGANVSTGTGVAVTAGQSWNPEQLAGPVMLLEGSLAGYIGGDGKGASGTLLSCEGSGVGRPIGALEFNFSGLGTLVGAAGVGVSGSVFWGELFLLSTDMGEAEDVLPQRLPEVRYTKKEAALHFPINGAQLRDEGKRLLEIFAACELPGLSRTGVELRIDGFADQPGDVLKNKILARNRAVSVFNYLKNILGPMLVIGDLKEPLSESEELDRFEAWKGNKAGGDDEGFELQSIDVSGVEIGAVGEPDRRDGEEERYDASQRRADVVVNRELRLRIFRWASDGL